MVYPATPMGLALSPLSPAIEGDALTAVASAGLGGLLGLGVMLAIYVAARGGMGGGDVKLGALIGVVLGVPLTFVALAVSFVVGGLVALLLLALRVRQRKEAIPFGPFLAGAAILVLFYGFPIYDWYRDLFLGL